MPSILALFRDQMLLGFAIPMLIATPIGLASLIVALLWVRRRMARNLCRIWYSPDVVIAAQVSAA